MWTSWYGSHKFCPCPQIENHGQVNQILYLLKLDTNRKLGLVKDSYLFYLKAKFSKWNIFHTLNTTDTWQVIWSLSGTDSQVLYFAVSTFFSAFGHLCNCMVDQTKLGRMPRCIVQRKVCFSCGTEHIFLM